MQYADNQPGKMLICFILFSLMSCFFGLSVCFLKTPDQLVIQYQNQATLFSQKSTELTDRSISTKGEQNQYLSQSYEILAYNMAVEAIKISPYDSKNWNFIADILFKIDHHQEGLRAVKISRALVQKRHFSTLKNNELINLSSVQAAIFQ